MRVCDAGVLVRASLVRCAAVTVEGTLLAAARSIGLDDDLNAGNWQELVRWYICSKLDAASLLELSSRQKGVGTAANDATTAAPAPAEPIKTEPIPVSAPTISTTSVFYLQCHCCCCAGCR